MTSTARAIVRDPDIRAGKWRLDGTRITVSDVRRWARDLTLDEINDEYHWPWLQLTQEELDACLAWEFPAIMEPRWAVWDSELVCACGEDIESSDDNEMWRCAACGRSWRVAVTISLDGDLMSDEEQERVDEYLRKKYGPDEWADGGGA